MRRRKIALAGVLALGVSGLVSPAIPPARAEEGRAPAALRRFTPHPADSLHYTAGILTFTYGDVDGDNDADIVGVDFYDAGGSTSLLWLNDGTGYYGDPIALPGSVNNATDVKLIDLDGDDDLDMVVGRTEEKPELLAFNDGDGGFSQTREFDTGFTFQVIAADFDGDDDPDLLTMNELDPDPFDPRPTDDRERLWLNNGTGVFTESARLNFGNWATGYPADVDGDMDLDLIVSNTQNTSVWTNDGAAHFTRGQQVPLAQISVQGVGDLDGDGDIDALGFPGEGEGVILAKNNGSGTFSFEPSPIAGISAGVLQLGDFDHDNDLDALRYSWNEPFTVLSNDGAGHFAATQSFAGGTVSRVMLADVNNDTWLDVAAGHNPHVSQNPAAPSVWLNEALEPAATIYLPVLSKP
ncbi:MAG TPA: VCBS repeat-containing protein [Herpetosiphonaceae bacterium]